MELPKHLTELDGSLYDTRDHEYYKKPPLRAIYKRTYCSIRTVKEFKATLRNGQWAWPGGYPMFLITSGGEALSFKAAKEKFTTIARSIRDKSRDGWCVEACDINYEDTELFCCHSNEKIESAYGD